MLILDPQLEIDATVDRRVGEMLRRIPAAEFATIAKNASEFQMSASPVA